MSSIVVPEYRASEVGDDFIDMIGPRFDDGVYFASFADIIEQP